jgi:uncharacterized protein (DUF1810 family)
MTDNDPYDLNRFVRAQEAIFEMALEELRNGRKRSHWMWFIFPQFEGLGTSETSRFYSIKSEAEARHYLDHPLLGSRLRQCAETVLAINGRTAAEIFGFPDDLKFKSSMTLFACVVDANSIFDKALEKYFDRKRDDETLRLLSHRNHLE